MLFVVALVIHPDVTFKTVLNAAVTFCKSSKKVFWACYLCVALHSGLLYFLIYQGISISHATIFVLVWGNK